MEAAGLGPGMRSVFDLLGVIELSFGDRADLVAELVFGLELSQFADRLDHGVLGFTGVFLDCGRPVRRSGSARENQICPGWKIESTDPRGYDVRIGKERTTRAGSGSDVLHDGEAAVPERRRYELASPYHVFRFGQSGEKLGSQSAWLAGDRGGRSGRTGDRLHGPGRHLVRWDAGTIHDALTAIRFEFAERFSAMTGKGDKRTEEVRPFESSREMDVRAD
jgi:hypothetical protein